MAIITVNRLVALSTALAWSFEQSSREFRTPASWPGWYWVAVKEPSLTYHSSQTILFHNMVASFKVSCNMDIYQMAWFWGCGNRKLSSLRATQPVLAPESAVSVLLISMSSSKEAALPRSSKRP